MKGDALATPPKRVKYGDLIPTFKAAFKKDLRRFDVIVVLLSYRDQVSNDTENLHFGVQSTYLVAAVVEAVVERFDFMRHVAQSEV